MSLLSYPVRKLIMLGVALLVLLLLLRAMGGRKIPLDRATQLKEIAKAIQASHSQQQLWSGEQACKHPFLPVDNPDLMKYLKSERTIDCDPEEDWVKIDGSTASITAKAVAAHGDIECSFTDILRTNDHATHLGLTTTTHTQYNLESSDFVRVRCAANDGSRWSSVLAGIRHDQDILDQTGWHHVGPNTIPVNVLMFGFDSISRNTFIRKLPQSYDYLTKELDAIVLEGYNIVGDGTPQALIPILTGKTELELPDTRKRMSSKAQYVNVYPFIWNKFKESGYATAYMEDTPSTGIFTYRLKGFDAEPTDHYMRPFYVDVEPDISKFHPYCIGSLPRHKIMLDYARHMFTVYKDKPKFVFGFHGELSHDSYDLISGADKDLLIWLSWFKKAGYLNDTILILMSDHGHRFAEIRNTMQGKLEERLPFFSFVLPNWFASKYPSVVANLKTNAKRLSTPFDIHATFLSLLKKPDNGFEAEGDLSTRGLSLFQEIPRARTCADAYIEPHWCACLEWQQYDVGDPVVKRGALEFVNFINNYNSKYSTLCERMSLKEVVWASRLLPSDALQKFKHSADVDGFIPDLGGDMEISEVVYQIKLATLPGPALFELSFTHKLILNSYSFRISDVSRINKYGDQARCIVNTQEQLRKYCYCKKNL